ncbi:hypothetical protein [Deinococcus sp. 6GRE01]|uniref:hypothetical protein n=1 Tax=Deinococcus sp. 6GRE01 TaxID=2745873 RepID=UPI001E4DF6ED|nr:hypothetical protein [Deinococcus sp. 6GRE01]MCD0156761.1 hypothetical protein [Deinococcus sp. 6GRE01]
MSREHVEFIELLFPMTATFGMDEREEIEEALHSRLVSEGVGEVSGAGAGMGSMNLDVDVNQPWQHQPEAVRRIVLGVLKQFNVPSTSTMRLFPLGDEKIRMSGDDL